MTIQDRISADEPLFALLKIGQADIEANRDGRLGTGQMRNLRSRARIAIAAGASLGTVLVAGALLSQANGGQWLVPALCGLAICGMTIGGAISRRRELAVPVRRLTGEVALTLVASGRAGSSLKLLVCSEHCAVPQSLRSTYKNWRAALSERPYHVYVIGKAPTVVGIEPASPGDGDRLMGETPERARRRTVAVSRRERFALEIDEGSGSFLLSLPVSNALVDYTEYYRIDQATFEYYRADLERAHDFVARCRDRQMDHLLVQAPGADRGIAG
jgi:hypothetical protein